jgi:histidine ammonia-lyase
MATFAANRLHGMLENVARILAIEMLAAAQGIEFHRPQHSSDALEEIVDKIRAVSPRYTSDRSLSRDIETLADMIIDGAFSESAGDILPSFAV